MIKNATKLFFFVSVFILSGVFQLKLAQADSSASCAIWLCLPAGFPGAECSAPYKEFKNRIKKGKPILPSLEGCSKGPNGRYSKGHYETGYEKYIPCIEGYTLKILDRHEEGGLCYDDACAKSSNQQKENDYSCTSYEAFKRPKPNFVKMWVDGKYLGQFFY